jgi:hypothetical protein
VVKDRFMFHTGGIVFMTLTINGTTIKRLLRTLQLTKESYASTQLFMTAMHGLTKDTIGSLDKLRGNSFYAYADWEVVLSFMPPFFDLEGEVASSKNMMMKKSYSLQGALEQEERRDKKKLNKLGSGGSGGAIGESKANSKIARKKSEALRMQLGDTVDDSMNQLVIASIPMCERGELNPLLISKLSARFLPEAWLRCEAVVIRTVASVLDIDIGSPTYYAYCVASLPYTVDTTNPVADFVVCLLLCIFCCRYFSLVRCSYRHFFDDVPCSRVAMRQLFEAVSCAEDEVGNAKFATGQYIIDEWHHLEPCVKLPSILTSPDDCLGLLQSAKKVLLHKSLTRAIDIGAAFSHVHKQVRKSFMDVLQVILQVETDDLAHVSWARMGRLMARASWARYPLSLTQCDTPYHSPNAIPLITHPTRAYD